ncbi:lasso peptide biosynthesis B2 protein [Streptomyces sp. NPDC050560]|uniref:lasso peptide biosynthesis B2 protein n=1 Tax=Streptomyces sp. NPDC050560 TaxID=3365630 RepID=UPI0037A83C3C
MNVPYVHEGRGRLAWRKRPAALVAVGAAHLLSRRSPERIRGTLAYARTGARPATERQARQARDAVVAVSISCAGEGCLPRSIATALLCRMHGTWPTWRTGVHLYPFSAHAWVEADGVAVGEPHPPGYYSPTLTVEPAPGGRQRKTRR